MFREVLDLQKRVRGPEHPDTLEAAVNLVSVLLREQGHSLLQRQWTVGRSRYRSLRFAKGVPTRRARR